MDKAGIDLLLVPVPPKAVIYPDYLEARTGAQDHPRRVDPHHQAFYDLLRQRGVAVLDLVPGFLEQRLSTNGPVFCRQDTHWSGRACILAAEWIAREIKAKAWWTNRARLPLRTEFRELEMTGDLWRDLRDAAAPKEKLRVRFVGRESGGKLEPVAPDRASPIVLLGDSHNLVFHAGDDMHSQGSGLADQLAWELGLAVDLVAVRGSGATPARINLLRHARQPNYLSGKKIVVWCFSAREFTESDGWLNVPVVRP